MMFRISRVLNRVLLLVDRALVAELTVDYPGHRGRISWHIVRWSCFSEPRDLEAVPDDGAGVGMDAGSVPGV